MTTSKARGTCYYSLVPTIRSLSRGIPVAVANVSVLRRGVFGFMGLGAWPDALGLNEQESRSMLAMRNVTARRFAEPDNPLPSLVLARVHRF